MGFPAISTPADITVPQTTAAALFLSPTPAKAFVSITAKASNTAEVRVGWSNTSTAIGVALLAGQSAKFLIDDAAKLYSVSSVAAQVVQVAIDAEPSNGGGALEAGNLATLALIGTGAQGTTGALTANVSATLASHIGKSVTIANPITATNSAWGGHGATAVIGTGREIPVGEERTFLLVGNSNEISVITAGTQALGYDVSPR